MPRSWAKGRKVWKPEKPVFERWRIKVGVAGLFACWPWLAATDGRGYGRIGRGRAGTGMMPAHRVWYEHLIGPIPKGLVTDHLCRNPICVNPLHLEPVTHAENVRRGLQIPICKKGLHSMSNAYRDSKTGRHRCRECHKANVRAWWRKRRVAS